MSHCIDYLCLYNNKTVPVEIINWVVKSVCIYTGHERRLFPLDSPSLAPVLKIPLFRKEKLFSRVTLLSEERVTLFRI